MALGMDETEEPFETETPLAEAMQQHLDALAKPQGSLGRLEEFATKLAVIQGRVPPVVERKTAVVCAADHGVVQEGVSSLPVGATVEMVRNFADGKAAVSILSQACDFEVRLVDCGLRETVSSPRVQELRAGPGTANFRNKPAMSHEQLFRCVENGRDLAGEIGGAGITPGADIVALGELGVGNTTTAAAVALALGAPEEVLAGGDRVSGELMERRQAVIRDALKRHKPFSNPYDVLRKVGGFEFATLVGIILGLRHRGIACVLDGFPATVAAYAAAVIDPHVTDFLFAGHRSNTRGHDVLLRALELDPILDLDMHVGEAGGAVLAGFQLDLAARLANGLARRKW